MSIKTQDRPQALTGQAIEGFLQAVGISGAGASTIKRYRNDLVALQRYLGPDASIHNDTLQHWASEMHDWGYAPRSINARLLTANRFLDYTNRPDLCQAPPQYSLKPEPSLTWTEYKAMLATARLQGCLRESLLMRIFVETGITTREVENITAEAVAAGYFRTDNGVICFSRALKNGLNEYVRQRGIQSGPVFLTRGNRPADRENIRLGIQRIARDTGLDQEKATPRSLQRLHNRYKSPPVAAERRTAAAAACVRLDTGQQAQANADA